MEVAAPSGKVPSEAESDCDTDLVNYTGGSLEGNDSVRTVAVQEGVTSIGSSAFRGCTNHTTITIPSYLSFGDRAFCGCTVLTTIIIPSSVTSIGDLAFLGCTGLTTITIPSSVTSSIGYQAFCDLHRSHHHHHPLLCGVHRLPGLL